MEGLIEEQAKFPTMSDQHATRTLLKSPPELWAECSDAQSLARHLDNFFGGIRITKLEPESTVAWEGERASGTVTLEPAGWGTRVTLAATSRAETEPSEPSTETVAERGDQDWAPAASRDHSQRPATFLARLMRRFGTESHPNAPELGATEQAPATASPEPPPDEHSETAEALLAALDSLGKAHHRPFSRA